MILIYIIDYRYKDFHIRLQTTRVLFTLHLTSQRSPLINMNPYVEQIYLCVKNIKNYKWEQWVEEKPILSAIKSLSFDDNEGGHYLEVYIDFYPQYIIVFKNKKDDHDAMRISICSENQMTDAIEYIEDIVYEQSY